MADAPLVLYQLYISHFCEKARWALDYKGLDYKAVNLLPGPHMKTARALSGQTALPILVHDDRTVNESSAIISYLDERFPQPALTPDDPALRREALEWEALADRDIGPHVRRICYQVLLDHPHAVLPLFTAGGPWYGPLMMRMAFPRLRKIMRSYMTINAEAAAESRAVLDAALDKIAARLEGRRFLVGDHFTRADLAVAALLAPMFMPEQYLPTRPTPPAALQAIMDDYAPRLDWARQLYAVHR